MKPKTVIPFVIGIFLFVMFFDDILMLLPTNTFKTSIHSIKLTPKGRKRVFYYDYLANGRIIKGFSQISVRYNDNFKVGDSILIEYSYLFDRVSRLHRSELTLTK